MTLWETMMERNRRAVLPQTALSTTRSPAIARAGTVSAATYASLRVGSDGSPVLALQQKLTALGYWLGGVDGAFGDLTRQAVVAIQKVSGLSRDGICGPLTWTRVYAGSRPRPRSARGHVVEISTTTQTLLIVDSGVVRGIYNTSTGSGQRYFQGGNWHIARTPSGMFSVIRRVDGWHSSPLGSLYRPAFFNDGIAVHGYTSVPSTPASHGCVRVSLRAMDNLWGAGGIQLASCVLVYSADPRT
jgi:N-acetylmuramoyl-L-alanine amidase